MSPIVITHTVVIYAGMQIGRVYKQIVFIATQWQVGRYDPFIVVGSNAIASLRRLPVNYTL